MANYDYQPPIYEANGDGSFTYRWNIREIQIPAEKKGKKATTQWECNEVVVWATVTRAKLTAAVLSALWDSDYEAKLQNDYNAAKEGILDNPEEGQMYIDRYKEFLSDRKAIKEIIKADCETLNII